MTSSDQLLLVAMRLMFESMKFPTVTPPMPTGYAKALQEQKDKSK